MATKNPDEVIAKAAPEEGVSKSMGTVRAAAAAAAEVFGKDEVEKHAQAIAEAWVARLKEQTREYTRYAMAASQRAAAGGEGAEIGFWSGGFPYPWFDLYMAGPYQFAPSSFAYLPHKIIRVDEWAYLVGVLWRNPAPINYIVGNPSAADMMAALNFSAVFESIDLTNVANGPDFGPFTFGGGPIGGGFINYFYALIPPNTFPAPLQGKPTLYEVNLTVDVTGPGIVPATLPFSGFATWQFDPDLQPPSLVPGAPPALKHDVPARFLVHS